MESLSKGIRHHLEASLGSEAGDEPLGASKSGQVLLHSEAIRDRVSRNLSEYTARATERLTPRRDWGRTLGTGSGLPQETTKAPSHYQGRSLTWANTAT